MKYLYVGILILCLLLGACWFSGQEIRWRTEAVTAPLQQALAALRGGDEARSRSFAGMAALEWEKNEGVLAALFSHHYTNEISMKLAELNWRHGEDFERVCDWVMRAVRELTETERVIWRNIF